MALQLTNDSVTFASRTGAPAPTVKIYSFTHPVTQHGVALTGFTAQYSNNQDHHLGRMEVDVTADIVPDSPKQVAVTITFGLRDYSGNWDDAYQGQVNYCLFVQTSSPPRPPIVGT